MIPSEQKILDFLREKRPHAQPVCAVARHFGASARDIRQILHDMAAPDGNGDYDLLMFEDHKGLELFEPAHGGYDPEPKGAA